MEEKNILVPKSISKLIGKDFFIPSYQRGYRWTEKEVNHLLDDIWDFATKPKIFIEGKIPFYCLQPIVVRKLNTKNEEFEVIDGQQRLTTIYLILKNLEYLIEKKEKNFNRIRYETRIESEHFLKNIDPSEANRNIDFYHIFQANVIIQQWFTNKAENSDYSSPKATFAPVFLDQTKVIWYEVNDDTNSIDIFTRLNIGKIQLTNSELIKALFLQRKNFKESANLKQLQIATEWDAMERALQNDSFWYFLYEGKKKYTNRIEYILDLIKGKKVSSPDNFTFYEFNKDFEISKKSKRNEHVDQIWMEIKNFYSKLEEWFNDDLFYHLIGYLIAIGININQILEIHDKAIDKRDFRKLLEKKISKEVKCEIKELEYKNAKIKKILLLLNVETILSNEKSSMRFPFNFYKTESWDIEHIRSQTDTVIKENSRVPWLNDIMEYYTGIDFLKDNPKREEIQLMINELTENKEQENCNVILRLLFTDQISEKEFNEIYNEVMLHFEERNIPDEIDGLGNLTLLDSYTNRSYKNAPFPIKRRTIMKNSSKGIFVPIATENVFMKTFTRRIQNMMIWTDDDAKEYMNGIQTVLNKYLPKSNSHE